MAKLSDYEIYEKYVNEQLSSSDNYESKIEFIDEQISGINKILYSFQKELDVDERERILYTQSLELIYHAKEMLQNGEYMDQMEKNKRAAYFRTIKGLLLLALQVFMASYIHNRKEEFGKYGNILIVINVLAALADLYESSTSVKNGFRFSNAIDEYKRILKNNDLKNAKIKD